jgi:hypothetical protein
MIYLICRRRQSGRSWTARQGTSAGALARAGPDERPEMATGPNYDDQRARQQNNMSTDGLGPSFGVPVCPCRNSRGVRGLDEPAGERH